MYISPVQVVDYSGILFFNKNNNTSLVGKEVTEERAVLCKMCYINQLEVLFIPCGHIATCVDCGTLYQNANRMLVNYARLVKLNVWNLLLFYVYFRIL